MPTLSAETCMSVTIQAQKVHQLAPDDLPRSSSDPGNTSACEHGREMLFSSGESSLICDTNQESTAPCSETNQNTAVQTLSDRLTPLLISAGLVCGIIPMSMRDVSNQLTLDAVLRPPDGEPVGELKEDS